MAKLTLEELRGQAEEGEAFKVKIGKDELELRLVSPTRAAAEAVAEIVAGDAASSTPGVDLAIMRRAEHAALAACCPDLEPDDRLIPLIRQHGGSRLQTRLFELCGLAARDDERVDGSGSSREKKSRSATS